eukprot:14076522-Alexandrium_andersonii.AAC.1
MAKPTASGSANASRRTARPAATPSPPPSGACCLPSCPSQRPCPNHPWQTREHGAGKLDTLEGATRLQAAENASRRGCELAGNSSETCMR